MAQKLTQRTTNPNPLTLADIIHAVSVADTTQSPQGSSYKNTLQALMNLIKLSGVGNWKTVAPTVNDDSTQGYVNGSFWFDENAQKFYILNDNSAGAADWVVFDLQFAYNGGNVVNGADIVIGQRIFAVGVNVLEGNTGIRLFAFDTNAAKNNSGSDVYGFGDSVFEDNSANSLFAVGAQAAMGSSYSGATIFEQTFLPQFADHSAAVAALTEPNGCKSGSIYLYRNQSNNTIGYVIP